MRQKFLVAIAIVVVVGVIGLIWSAVQPPGSPNLEANIINAQDFELPSIGFARVDGTYEWEFPRDLGPHPRFQQETWQFETMNDSCPFQLEVIFNRVSILPETLQRDRSSEWAITSILNATLIIAEDGENVIETSRTSRVALDLAGADENQVWVENWSLDWANGELRLSDEDAEIQLSLNLNTPETTSDTEEWYQYQQSGEMSGEISLGEAQNIDCSIRLTHRFG